LSSSATTDAHTALECYATCHPSAAASAVFGNLPQLEIRILSMVRSTDTCIDGGPHRDSTFCALISWRHSTMRDTSCGEIVRMTGTERAGTTVYFRTHSIELPLVGI
jgi:hypothetical protein